jgi:hypothetical protein
MTAAGRASIVAVGAFTRRALAMQADDTRALPVEWAFVVHLRPRALPEQGQISGRVEHVSSGRSAHFASLPELLAFLGGVLRNLREDVE